MRHRKRGRVLGRNPAHRKALLRNLASALMLTEDPSAPEEGKPKVAGRIVTTLEKAKEVRPLVERCVTIAKKSLPAAEAAQQFATDAKRGSDAWEAWRKSEKWSQWVAARAPVVTARRRLYQILGDKRAVSILFSEIAPRYVDRPGGYTRVARLAKPRLGDAGTRAILEFVGNNDRARKTAPKPQFDAE
jgi:large subunit ribosomal protein L17